MYSFNNVEVGAERLRGVELREIAKVGPKRDPIFGQSPWWLWCSKTHQQRSQNAVSS